MGSNAGMDGALRRRRNGIFKAVAASFTLLVTALALILNGCGGSSSSQPSISVPPPSGVPSVASVASTTCTSDFFSDTSTPAVCNTAILTGCPNASPLTFTFSYDLPATTPKGTIVFFSGGDGTGDSGDVTSAGYYFSQGFEVIQVEWSYDWEVTDAPTANNGGVAMTTYPSNVQLGACRGATFLNYVFNMNNTNLYTAGGRCAQGSSAGSGMIAYALTFYGAGNYLDAVELKSGPPIADFEQGCEEPPAADVTVCGQNNGNQFGCQLGGTSPWTLSPTYTGAASGVRTWTGDSSCAVPNTTTSSTSNTAWLQESIVNGGTPAGVYSYPNTAMTAWLCQTVDQPAGMACTGGNAYGQGGMPQNSCPNNSTSQAEIYYAKLTSDPNNLPQAPYNIYAVQNCAGPEGVDSPTSMVAALNNLDGGDAIEADMIKQCMKH